MLNIYICEDNEKQREKIQQLVADAIQMEELDMELEMVTDNPMEVLEHVQMKKENGIFFLDIDLQDRINGLELAKQIRKYQPRCYIIFITSHSEMSYMTFTYKVEAMDYIIKDDYHEMKNRIFQCLLQAYKLNVQNAMEDTVKTFSVKVGSKVQSVNMEDILFFEMSATPHKLILHTKEAVIEFVGKMKDLEKELPSGFYRCHRSFIANKANIEAVDEANNIIRFQGGMECPVSVRLGKGLKK